jgi:hypothetical protein
VEGTGVSGENNPPAESHRQTLSWKVNTFILKRVVVVAWLLDLQLPMQSVPITTTVVSLNPAHFHSRRKSGCLLLEI